MIGGFEMFGQLSTLSGTPSASASSCTVPQVPLFVTLVFMQVCATRLTQVWPPWHPWALMQRTEVLMLQWPTAGQSPLAVQNCSLMRLQEPLSSVVVVGLPQSPSQASPTLSRSVSFCDELKVRTQLSSLSAKPSPSRSPLPLHAAPLVEEPPAGTCAGL